ncbi:MAG: FMN-binding protein [Treponema sp.]|nr:FMN-binding protein [Treponema sp.]
MYAGKVVLVSVFLISLVFPVISCSKSVPQMKDGYYTAETKNFDKFGWKEFLAIRVSGGKIIHVEYDARNPSGFIKSWDMEYMRKMNAAVDMYPNAFTRIYGNELLGKQSTANIDCVTGATYSYHTFLSLANAALENAYLGKTDTRTVDTDNIINTFKIDN